MGDVALVGLLVGAAAALIAHVLWKRWHVHDWHPEHKFLPPQIVNIEEREKARLLGEEIARQLQRIQDERAEE